MTFSTLTFLASILLASILSTSAQSTNTSACISNLIPCANYLGSTSAPPQSCCVPLKTAITTQIDCLCGLYNTPGLLKSFNINITQALDLPKRCRIDGASLAACSKVAGAAASPSPSPSESVAPTGISGTPGKDENASWRMNGFGISGLVCLISWIGLLLW